MTDRLPITPPDEAAPPPVCRRLRAKIPPSSWEELGTPWEHGEASNATYWCLDTMDAAGPDDGFVHAHVCRSHRGCYRPRD